MTDTLLTIRMAAEHDARALRRLAGLDSSRPLAGRVLLAEVDGATVAAVSLETGKVTADPFLHTADAVRMLLLRREQLAQARADGPPAPPRLRRLTPAAVR